MSKITVTIEGIELEVEYAYQPYEQQTLEHPGFVESYEIEQIFIRGVEVTKFIAPFYFKRIINVIKSLITNQLINNE